MSSQKKPKIAYLSTRVTEDTRTKFQHKACKYGTVSDVLCEMIEAFIEDRLSIYPPVTSKKESLYVTRK